MTVALRMTGALIVAPAGTPDDPYARVVFRLADGRELRYRDVRKFGRIGLWEGGGLARRAVQAPWSVQAGGRTAGAVPGGRRLRAPRAGAAGRALQRRPAGRAAARAVGAAEDAAARPVVHRRRRQHLRRRGAVAGAAPPAACRRHADPGRGAAAASRHPRRPAPGDRQPGHRASATTSVPMASRATTPSGWRSTAGPASPACAAAGRSSGSWSGSAARTSARAARRRRRQRGAAEERMKVIGLTGNIGCGKSTVAGMLRELGVAVIDLDAVARQIRNNDAEARARSRRRFGTIDAGKLAGIVFSDPAALRGPGGDPAPARPQRDAGSTGRAGGGRRRGGLHRGDQAARVAAARRLRQHLGRALRRGGCAWRASRRRAA